MGIVNRRNAVLGWAVWQVVRRAAKMKVRDAVPGTGNHVGLNKSAIATILLTLGGALLLWRKKSGESAA
jgi:hypothetical protein